MISRQINHYSVNLIKVSARPNNTVIMTCQHYDEEERHMSSMAISVTIKVHSCTQLVAVAPSIERLRVKRDDAPLLSIADAQLNVADLPQQHTIVSGHLQKLTPEIEVHNLLMQVGDHIVLLLKNSPHFLCSHNKTVTKLKRGQTRLLPQAQQGKGVQDSLTKSI